MTKANYEDGYVNEEVSTLVHNVNAVRAVSSAVEGTLGPKGLDSLLVDGYGDMVVTNDGVTILEKMEVKHPAARMLIKIAAAQQEKIGDGTTTATILASALVQEGAEQVHRGVPVVQVISGLKKGVEMAISLLEDASIPVPSLQDANVSRVAYTAAREQDDISQLVLEGAKMIGYEKLKQEDWRLSDLIFSYQGEESEVFSGIMIGRAPVSKHMPTNCESPSILIIEDQFGPEELDEESLGTEQGFTRFLEFKESFKYNLEKIAKLGINVIITQRSCDPIAEEFCIDHEIAILQRVGTQELIRLAEHTGARAIKRTGLNKSIDDLAFFIGKADRFKADIRTSRTRIESGKGQSTATILIGGSTSEIVSERGRIAKDAAASVQAAVRGGILPGGGSIELAVSSKLERNRTVFQGLEGYGADVVIKALQKPMAQMARNAGFNALEKIEAVRTAQYEFQQSCMGIDLSTGNVVNLHEQGIFDPTLVKIYALKSAAEVAESILRIHTVIRMKMQSEDQG